MPRKPKSKSRNFAAPKASAENSPSNSVGVRKSREPDAWEFVHPRCAGERKDDLDEVRKMVEADELDVARDELRWLLDGCGDNIAVHLLLGEVALLENDLPLARGHFGYAYQLGAKALDRAKVRSCLPYRLPANQAFFQAGKGLAFCLKKLGKAEIAQEVVDRLLACDPSDPLALVELLKNGHS